MGAVPGKSGYSKRKYPSSIGGRSPSLKWPHLYDILHAKGYSKEKAARISNSRIGMRKNGKLKGLPYKQADNPKALARVLKKSQRKRKDPKAMAAALIAACHSASCAPPPAGSGGSDQGGFTHRVGVTRKVDGPAKPAAPQPQEQDQVKRSNGKPELRTPIEHFGPKFDPKGANVVDTVRRLDANGQIDWAAAEHTTISPKDFGTLHANERDVKQATVDKVAGGSEPIREGYVTKIYEAPNGDRHIVDGHHRVAIHAAAGKDLPVQIYKEKVSQFDPFRKADGTVDRARIKETIKHLSKSTPEETLWAAHHQGMVNADDVTYEARALNKKIGSIYNTGPLRGIGTALQLGRKGWKPAGDVRKQAWNNG